MDVTDAGKEMGVDVKAVKLESNTVVEVKEMTKDEHHLATLGYKQVFVRSFGLFENWAATFVRPVHVKLIQHVETLTPGQQTTMNFVSGMPVLFGFAMYTGGPQAAFANWCMVGGFSLFVSLAMAEIAASLPTAGGIYYWSHQLGGPKHGPFLAWITAWFNWAGWITIVPGASQGCTNFLVSLLTIAYPDSEVIQQRWFGWCMTSAIVLLGTVLNCASRTSVQWMLRSCAYSTVLLLAFYWVSIFLRVDEPTANCE